MKRFISVWVPDWPIARLRRDEPASAPHDRPFALVGIAGGGLVITACNTAAARAGITPGQHLANARALVPGLATREAEPQKDRAALLALAAWAGRYGPRTNVDGGEEGFWIDWPAVGKDSGQEALVIVDLQRRLAEFGLEARVAVADTFGAAFALARFAVTDGHRPVQSLRGGAENALARLAVEALRLPNSAVLMLRRLGFKRIGQLYDIARAALADQIPSREVADAVLLRLDQALGLVDEPLRALSDPLFTTSAAKQREAVSRSAPRPHFLSAIGTVLGTPSAPMKTANTRIGPEPMFFPL